MAISRKLITLVAVSAIGLIAISAAAHPANDDASRKDAPKNSKSIDAGGIQHTDDWRERTNKGNTEGKTWVSGDPVEFNLRKKESGGNAQEKVQYNDWHFSNRTANQTQNNPDGLPTTLPPGATNWQVDQKLGQPDYRKAKARPKANSKSRRRN